MSTYIFILGKDRKLSIAELYMRYSDANFKIIGTEFVAMEIDRKIDQEEFDKLGGSIKAAEIVCETDKKSLVNKIIEQLESCSDGTKLNFGLSVYDWSETNLKTLVIGARKGLKEKNVSSRFTNNDFKNITAAQYKGFSKKGVEFCIIRGVNSFIIAKTIAIQDIDSYSIRDFKKPFRSMQVGMLPPKLAQIMINLTGSTGTIWDAFCGGGVLVMEGLLMGNNMLGSDINEKTLEGAENNINWIKNQFRTTNNVDLFFHDATSPLHIKKFDAIACEGYLGPPQKTFLEKDEAETLAKELTSLYVDFFRALKTANVKVPVVIALPYFKLKDKLEVHMRDAVNNILDLSFELVPLSPNGKVKVLKYSRDNQVVGRAIHHFVLK